MNGILKATCGKISKQYWTELKAFLQVPSKTLNLKLKQQLNLSITWVDIHLLRILWCLKNLIEHCKDVIIKER